MEITNICCSTSSTEIIHLGRPRPINHNRPLKSSSSSSRSSSRWKSLWKKIMREKRKMGIFECNTVAATQVHLPGYDPKTYAKNFDQGLLWEEEPDLFSRSFSMRFAAPSRLINTSIFNKNNNNNINVINNRSVSDVGHAYHRDIVICVF
ncbi:uncharacterized protein LOC130824567 [Amaranthus tricolor]|uniref:uncharacterized protein LOC130824567 n=1 Tax=Amaranthus tricolor TaxID=29722 RepID=UPI002590A621|nr:uncharacterized protein LOC130824567 [Amaranthus tricolor]